MGLREEARFEGGAGAAGWCQCWGAAEGAGGARKEGRGVRLDGVVGWEAGDVLNQAMLSVVRGWW